MTKEITVAALEALYFEFTFLLFLFILFYQFRINFICHLILWFYLAIWYSTILHISILLFFLLISLLLIGFNLLLSIGFFHLGQVITTKITKALMVSLCNITILRKLTILETLNVLLFLLRDNLFYFVCIFFEEFLDN